jgi:CelD/BcsL family acetyltransferase involved in cellulose biosynthesis
LRNGPEPLPLTVQMAGSVEAIESLGPEIDRLAVTCGQPLMSPVWTLGWWRHRRPVSAALRAVAVQHGGRLVGFAPFFVDDGQARGGIYRLVGAGSFFRMEPLAARGYEDRVAQAIANTLAVAEPAPRTIRFEGIDAASTWPYLLEGAWPGRVRPYLDRDRAATQSAPTLSIGERTFDDWLARKSRNFRSQVGKRRRRAARCGAAIGVATTHQELGDGLEALFRLHHRRWDRRGGSGALDDTTERLLRDVTGRESRSERHRLFTLARDGQFIACYLCAAAGGQVTPVQLGFDPATAALSPGNLVVLAALEDAFARGDRRFDFGPGAEPYKLRFADKDEPLAWTTLVPRGRSARIVRLRLSAHHGFSHARRLWRQLPPGARRAIRRLG